MARTIPTDKTTAPTPATASAGASSPAPGATLGGVWQLPVLLVSIGLFAAGLYLARPGDPTPRYAESLDRIAQLIRAGQYATAIEGLGSMEGAVPTLPLPMQGRFFLLVADSHYLMQKQEGWNLAENHRKILAGYEKATAMENPLDTEQKQRMAETLAALGRDDAALKVLGDLGEPGRSSRQSLLKRMVQAAMSASPPRHNEAEHLLSTLSQEPGLTPANAVWAVAREADLLLNRGETERAIEMLLRRVRVLTLDDAKAPIGELATQLGRAYMSEGDGATAERWLTQAQQSLATEDPLNADVLAALGELRFQEGNIVEALEHFAAVAQKYPQSPRYREAVVGKAECEARLGSYDRALLDYEAAVKVLGGDLAKSDVRLRRLRESLATQHELRFGEGQYAMAMQFLDLERKLYDPPLPAEMLLKLARTHEALARTSLGLGVEEPETPESWAKAEKRQREKAADHFAQAADYFLTHARAITIQDDGAYGQSLWKAGDYYDRSGLYKRAIDVFDEYRKGRPDDPKSLAAAYRLGRAYQAAGRYDEAVVLYSELIEQHPKAPEAYQSLVPLAASHLAASPPDLAAAEQVLRSVIENHPALRPESNEYREALITLGQLYYRRGGEGDYERAIERINEAVTRYGDDARVPQLEYQLGDAYRESIEQLDAKLAAGSLPPSKKLSMQLERGRRLSEAQRHFDAVIVALEQPGKASTLDALEQLYLRNAYFYRADCAYNLNRFEGEDGAIGLYEKALQRYDRDPAALVALIQIANAYSKLGQHDKARIVNERAKVLLKRIPEEKFDDPNLPMDRHHWQRWLDWTSQLASTETKEADPAP